jgi:hypothetical protein
LIGSECAWPLDRSGEEVLQAVRDVGAPEKLARIPKFVRVLAKMDLPKIGSELGLLIPATGDIPVWADDFPPGLQLSGCLALDGSAGGPALLSPDLFLKADAQQLHLELLDVIGLRSRHGTQQTPDESSTR